MSESLDDFFKLIAEDKKKKKEEFNEMVGDLGLDSLFEDIAAEKKKVKEEKEKEIAEKIEEEQKKKEEFDQLLGDMSLDSLFGDLAKAKKEVEEESEKEEERQKKVLTSFENFLTQKIDDIEEIKEELVEEVEPEKEIIEEDVEVLQEVIEEPSLVEKSLGLLSEPSENIPGAEQNFATLDDLQKHYKDFLVKIQQQLSTIGGGGIEDAPKTGGPYARRNQAWEFITTGADSDWIRDTVGISTVASVGIGTIASSSFDLTVKNTVSIGNTFTYPEYITGGMVPRAIKSQGGYDRTSAFVDYQTGTEASQDPADYIEYTQELADSDTWYRFGMTTAGNQARDGQWWGETNPQYDQSKGLFGGLTAPAGVDHFFDFSENTAFNNAQTSGSLKYTQALGSFSLKECQVGDLVLARFDFNVMPMVTNTTVQVALIYANRDENDAITFTFPLTITPFFYGSGSVGKGFLLRPTITAYMANQQDVNSRSLVAIKADNPILVNPIGVLFTIQR